MALEVSEFDTIGRVDGLQVQIAPGQPLAVHTTTGAKTLNAATKIIRISGTGTVTWPNGLVETFAGIEYRAIIGAQVITLA